MACDQTVWRVFDPLDQHPSAQRLAKWFKALKIEIPDAAAETVLIVCRKRKDGPSGEGGKLLHQGTTWRWVYDLKAKSALIGVSPKDPERAKLKQIKAVKVLGDNYGLALDPEPTMLRPIKVWEQLAELRSKNGGKRPRVLRIGSVVEIPNKTGRSDYRGVWMVRGVQNNQKAGFLLDLSGPDRIKYRVSGQTDAFQNVRLTTVLADGLLLISDLKMTGIASKSRRYEG